MIYSAAEINSYRPGSRLRSPDPQGREAERLASRAGVQVRVGDQPQDRQGAWPHNFARSASNRRRGDRMKRREFIAGLGAAAWPLAARGQQQTKPVIGLIGTTGASRYNAAFLRG
jgi:hypothetical protein